MSRAHLRFALLLLWAATATPAQRQELVVTRAGDSLRIAAPGLRFLNGKADQRLRNGKSVAFEFQLLALGDGRSTVLRRAFERVVISYDIWEQTYSATRLRSNRGSTSHLSAAQLETWCLDGIALPVGNLPSATSLWFRLDIRALDPKDRDGVFADDDGLSLTGLIDLFSRAGRGGRAGEHWRAEAGPVQLASIPSRAVR